MRPAANAIVRRGHGRYEITDPFVQRIRREREALPVRPDVRPARSGTDARGGPRHDA